MGGTNTNKRSGAFGMGGNAMRAASMAANAGQMGSSNPASSIAGPPGAFRAPGGAGGNFPGSAAAPSGGNGPAWQVGDWSYKDGNYYSPTGGSYSYDKSTGWKSNDGYTGITSLAASPAQTYKQERMAAGTWAGNGPGDPNSPMTRFQDWKEANPRPTFDGSQMQWNYSGMGEDGKPNWTPTSNVDAWRTEYDQQRGLLQDTYGKYVAMTPGLKDRTNTWGAYGLDPKAIQSEYNLTGNAWDRAMNNNGAAIYNAQAYAKQFNRPAFNAAGAPLLSNGYYANELNSEQRMALGLRLPNELRTMARDSSAPAESLARLAQRYVPTEQGGWMRAPTVMDANRLTDVMQKEAEKAFQQGIMPAQQFMPSTEGLGQTGFAGGFTTGAFTGPPVAPVLTKQDFERMYKAGG